MAKYTQEQHSEFLDYWNEQFNVHDIYIKISGAPKGFIAWAANRTMLEMCINKAGIEGPVDYQKIPNYVLWFKPATGATSLEAAQRAVELYQTDLEDPEARTYMNIGCVTVAEALKSESSI